MISLVVLLSAWLFVLSFSPFRSFNNLLCEVSLFAFIVLASSCLYVLYYVQINFLPSLLVASFCCFSRITGSNSFFDSIDFQG